MAELLIRGIDNVHPDPDQDLAYSFKKGDIVDVFDDGGAVGEGIVAPNFAIMQVFGVTADEYRLYRDQWNFTTEYNEISVNPVTDSARVSMFNSQPGNSNQFLMTRALAEPLYNWWGAIFANEQPNDIRFDALVLNAYRSDGFWEWGLPDPNEPDPGPLPITITETDYDQPTRMHTATITNDERVMPWATVAQIVARRGGTLSDPVGDTATMMISGDAVVVAMKEDMFVRLYNPLINRRWYIDPANVNLIQSLPGNTIRLSPEDAQLQILDKQVI